MAAAQTQTNPTRGAFTFLALTLGAIAGGLLVWMVLGQDATTTDSRAASGSVPIGIAYPELIATGQALTKDGLALQATGQALWMVALLPTPRATYVPTPSPTRDWRNDLPSCRSPVPGALCQPEATTAPTPLMPTAWPTCEAVPTTVCLWPPVTAPESGKVEVGTR